MGELEEKDRRSLWHPYTKRSAIEAGSLPVIVRGDGPYLYDREGRRYVDAIASWWAASLGHNHPRLVAALREQAGELVHSILGNLSHPWAIELADQIVALFPTRERHVLFACDGSSAVEAALKIAVQYWAARGRPEKHRFASLENGYHGDTLGAVSVGFIEHFHRAFSPLTFAVERAESPCCGTCRHGKEPASCDLACFESMRRIVVDHARELAAVIVEPLCQAAGGMRIYSERYVRELAALCSENEVLLILDEIAVGFGRTGTMFAFERAGVDPDIVCLGKSLSGGYAPISATVVVDAVYEAFRDAPEDRTFYHGHTFSGYALGARVALETLAVYREEGIVERARETGELMRREFARFAGLANVVDVRCLGMIGVVELVPGWAERVRRQMLAGGYLVRPLGDVVYLMPPLVVPPELLREAIDALDRAVTSP